MIERRSGAVNYG